MTAGNAGIAMWLRRAVFYVAVFAVLAGTFARFERLDFKIFWPDETFSMLRITGHTESDLWALVDRRRHSVQEFQALDQLDVARGYHSTLVSMREEPQRGPLFYLAARAWASAFGDSVACMRALTAFLGLAGIVLGFILGCAMAGGRLGGAVMASLLAVSPIMLQFSRQLREYIGLADVTVASALVLLLCLERPTVVRFAAYTAGSIAGFFISPIFVTVWCAHALTVLSSRQPRRVVVRWCVAFSVSATVCLPWFVESLRAAPSHAGDLAWLANPYAPMALVQKWAFNIGAVFFDSEVAVHAFSVVLIPTFAIVAFAVAVGVRRTRDVRFALALSTIVCGFAPSIVIDAVKHYHFEAVTRYQMVAWVGVDMLVALTLAGGLISVHARQRKLAASCYFFLVSAGLVSCVFDRSYEVWWDNNEHIDDRAVTAAISSHVARAVVLSPDPIAAFTLSRYLPADTRIVLYDSSHRLPVAPLYSFLLDPSHEQVARYRQDVERRPMQARVEPISGLIIPMLDVGFARANGDGAYGHSLWWITRDSTERARRAPERLRRG